MKSQTCWTFHLRGLFLGLASRPLGALGPFGGVERLEVFTRGATASFPPSDFSFFSGGCSEIFSLFSVFLLLDPGGRPGPLFTGTAVLVGTVFSSFSDFRLSGAENINI